MVELLISGFVVISFLHAGLAAFVTRRTLPGAPDRLWERLALVSTSTMVVLALSLLWLAFADRRAEVNVVPLGFTWGGTLLVEWLGVFVLRRASPRLAASAVFLVLLAPPLTLVGRAALELHHLRTHWHCMPGIH